MYRELRRLLAFSFLIIIFSAGTAYSDGIKINILANGKTLNATLEDNPVTRMLCEQMPLALPMRNLYGREMCYNIATKLPTGKLVANNYKVGDIIYWPPQRSLVILYKQNGERFQRMHLGHIESGVEVFENSGDTLVTFVPAE